VFRERGALGGGVSVEDICWQNNPKVRGRGTSPKPPRERGLNCGGGIEKDDLHVLTTLVPIVGKKGKVEMENR